MGFFSYYYDTCGKMREIFSEHCNLSMEQYEEISAQFIFLLSDIQDMEPQEEIEKRMGYLRTVFEFLYNTKELTLKEDYELNKMLDDIWGGAQKQAAEEMLKKGPEWAGDLK